MAPPLITIVKPADNAEGVEKNTPIIFDLTDAGSINLDETRAAVRGELVISAGENISEDWAATITAIASGYRFELTPKPVMYYRNQETVTVAVHTADDSAETADASWSFAAAARAFTVSIYPLILSSLRKGDS